MTRSQNRHRNRRLVHWLAIAGLLAVLPLVFRTPLSLLVLNQMGTAMVLALSYNIVLGRAGLLSFGHAIYFGLGGFAAVRLLAASAAGVVPLPVPFIPLAGGLGGLFFAFVFGSFSVKRTGIGFAMITLCTVELVIAAGSVLGRFYGGAADRTLAPAFFGLDFASEIEVYYVIAGWLFACLLAARRFLRTPVGQMAAAVRDNPERAAHVGYNPRLVRLLAFCVGGFFAGIAGGLFAINYEFVGGETISLATSFQILMMAFIGGIGSFIGPLLGAVIFTLLQTVVSNYTGLWILYAGIVFVAVARFAPTGLAGLIEMHAPAARAGRLGLLVRPYITVGLPALVCLAACIGLLELADYWRDAESWQPQTSLFGLVLDVTSPLPWLAFGVLAVAGFALARRGLPALSEAWHAAVVEGTDSN
ncbi:MAG TPA: branched-chain amino acid ABC transporter permease [Alphaproteobacteria bacterium]|nr:branched-chain amino acid ABC transporter permease [Alphaproteobacteria bacterium]MDP7164281.1 branched-chain amino acid ABC transporter permease [Alphaproteobacteria bacterium]HJM49432.1 branched-chain amino acid ABC transporter permease [Alphaproteobacteria bacterium]